MLFLDDLEHNPFPQTFSEETKQELIRHLHELEANACFSIANDEVVGILCVGAKLDGQPFFVNDIEWFSVIGKQFALAIERSLLINNLESIVRQRTAQLEEANAELHQISEAKSEFVSVASHQLRTPLSVIKSIFSLYLSGDLGRLTKLQKEYANKGFAQSQKLILLIQQLLNISRIEAGRISLSLEQVRLDELARETADEFATLAQEKGLALRIEAPAAVPLVSCDASLVTQVIANLVDNAIKYTDEGSITLFVEPRHGAVAVRVVDTGRGITTHDHDALFQRFSRGSDRYKSLRPGTGLGLYFARRVIEAHGGTIGSASDGEGKGSEFYFELPI